ncbi:hypothetical protein Tcan_10940 [Toxocara canis]|uniref:Uncharacterized protein n=1 Tax=Toxocara canis TaxID=6265 RepID=A0A0B2V1D4_TOXCA|nr:hypothetical protein Tcan_10940 [Toxocara canis]
MDENKRGSHDGVAIVAYKLLDTNGEVVQEIVDLSGAATIDEKRAGQSGLTSFIIYWLLGERNFPAAVNTHLYLDNVLATTKVAAHSFSNGNG